MGFSLKGIVGAAAGFVVGGPAGAAVGYGIGSSGEAADAAAKASGRAVASSAAQEEINRALNIERYEEAQRLLSPYIGTSNVARQRLERELFGGQYGASYLPSAGGPRVVEDYRTGTRGYAPTTGYLPGAYAAEQQPDPRESATLEAVLAETPLPTRPTSYSESKLTDEDWTALQRVRLRDRPGAGTQLMLDRYETDLAAAQTTADEEVARRIAALEPEEAAAQTGAPPEGPGLFTGRDFSMGDAYMGEPAARPTAALEGEYIPAGTGITDFYGEAGEIAPGGAYRDPTQYMADISAGYEDFVANNPVYQKMIQSGISAVESSAIAGGRATGSTLKALSEVGQGVEAQFFTNYMNTVGDITSMNETRFRDYVSSGEQRNINEQNLLEGRRVGAENIEEQRYANYMNMLQNLASPSTATNLASLGVNQGITQGQTSAQAIAAQNQYSLGAVSAANAARSDVAGGIMNLGSAYMMSGGGQQPGYSLPQTTGTIYGGGSTPQPINYGGYA